MWKLQECYKKPSIKKIQAYNDLIKWAEKLNATKYGIISYNIYHFTFKIVTADKIYIITKKKILEKPLQNI